MDSDKKNSHSRINATKLRIKAEFEQHGGIAWITKGREVENYINHARLQRGVAAVYDSTYSKSLAGSQFDHALEFERAAPKRRKTGTPPAELIESNVDKVKVSRIVASDGVDDLDVLDLKDRISDLVQMIRGANS